MRITRAPPLIPKKEAAPFMIITCPECDTRYTVKASAFKAPGRKVRCASCSNEWFQAPPDDAPMPVEPDAPIADDEVPAPPPAEDEANADTDMDEGDGASDDIDPLDDDVNAVVARAREAAAARERAKKEKVTSPFFDASASSGTSSGRSRGTVVGWVLLLGFLAALIGALLAFRGDVIRFWPATAAIYEALGLPVAAQNMEFRKVGFEVSKENGLSVLAIRGEIVNVGDDAGPVPRVRVALRDAAGEELYHYFFAIPEAELAAGATAEFVTRLSSPPAAANDLVLRFVEPGEFIGQDTPKVVPADDAAQ